MSSHHLHIRAIVIVSLFSSVWLCESSCSCSQRLMSKWQCSKTDMRKRDTSNLHLSTKLAKSGYYHNSSVLCSSGPPADSQKIKTDKKRNN
ncbi:hypothetical protein TNIN_313041 [Trichonephila inaurata madagascariensis]|uniref:Secreted protein n=1 Tax=Trichonephila inaurata madagascariensis TaxID=2747483 RepID=A0A8X7CI14_9ARAC|nr:hypothetical protein TNIN_313041 [Trichonephila inaurata madagascariensis]